MLSKTLDLNLALGDLGDSRATVVLHSAECSVVAERDWQNRLGLVVGLTCP